MNNYIQDKTVDVITYPCSNLSESLLLVKGAPASRCELKWYVWFWNTVYCKNIYIVHALLYSGNVLFYPYPSGLFPWHWGNHMIALVPVKQTQMIWLNHSHESLGSLWYIASTKQSITKPCLCCMGYTVCVWVRCAPCIFMCHIHALPSHVYVSQDKFTHAYLCWKTALLCAYLCVPGKCSLWIFVHS